MVLPATGLLLIAVIAVIAVLVLGGGPRCAPDDAVLPYADAYPAIAYGSTCPGGAAGQLAGQVSDGTTRLQFQPERGYLDSMLAELGIESSSQTLVFSRTSLQVGLILPETPRAIYFNDDSYVAWVPGSRSLEIASFDPELGPVFYTVLQDATAEPLMERQLGTCLRCHDTYSLTGGGVPRFLLGSGYTGTDGELVSHEAWILTSQATPLSSRWGGWYVTGRHGDAGHLGNMIVQRAEDLQALDSLRIANVDELGGYFDTASYLTPFSDIVALMVLEHQVEVQNLISRLRFEALGTDAGITPDDLDAHVEALVRAMLMIDEIALTSSVEGGSGFAEHFESLGPYDSNQRSLRDFDLSSRLFRYPLSYLIYSSPFQALPPVAKDAVYRRLSDVLNADPEQDGFLRLTVADRTAIAEILAETLPEFAGY